MGDIVCALLDKRDGIFRVLLDKRDVDSTAALQRSCVRSSCWPDNGKPHRHSMEFKKQFKKTAYLLYLPQSRT